MDIIKILNKLSFRVLEIQNLRGELDYFAFSQFNEATNTEHKHTVRGKDITHIVNSNLHLNLLDTTHNEKITNDIVSIQEISKFYHRDLKFIMHV